MDPNSYQKEKLSINEVEKVTISHLDSYWQPYDLQNDLGIDGIIFLGKRGHQTGQFLYVQVKSGDSYISSQNEEFITLAFNSSKLQSWRNTWSSKKEPVIFIYLDSLNNIYWKDVKEDTGFTKSCIKIPKFQKFNEKCKSKLTQLCGSRQKDSNLQNLSCRKEDRSNIYNRGDLKIQSKILYNTFKFPNSICYANEYFSDLRFTRLGWNHITSSSRTTARITHSLSILGITKIILENERHYNILKSEMSDNCIVDYLGIRSIINFKERTEGIIQIVILRKRIFDKQGAYNERMWFLSIHEINKK